ncbi:unnamed protein product [Prunus armeniaca]|uniref:Uncharacterized protein n=1 Tax=Prunus armeniaca TaxID=36596 RepID=A0A6J5W5N9_PRUAR|nr:unnamed protein product [Prunus armeniaca]
MPMIANFNIKDIEIELVTNGEGGRYDFGSRGGGGGSDGGDNSDNKGRGEEGPKKKREERDVSVLETNPWICCSCWRSWQWEGAQDMDVGRGENRGRASGGGLWAPLATVTHSIGE